MDNNSEGIVIYIGSNNTLIENTVSFKLAQKLGYSKSTTHGLVHALIHEGALAQANGGKKLLMGSTVVELAFQSWNYLVINQAAQPILEELRRDIGESVFLGVFNRSNARAIIMARLV